jgi:hypothetical protein
VSQNEQLRSLRRVASREQCQPPKHLDDRQVQHANHHGQIMTGVTEPPAHTPCDGFWHGTGPIMLIWDDLSGHVSTAMHALIAARPWLRVYALPAYAPELKPVEKVWSHLKRSLANLAAGNVTNLARLAKTRLKKVQYTDGLIDGFIKGTGLSPP